ncbi:MAG: hypothetical protein GX660_21155 [Clostridiaceae bacterium]|nr:hypothetical protein [Clostridiaceae bacterium]
MSYRRIPRIRRYYTSSSENNKQYPGGNKGLEQEKEIKDVLSIPLPNEKEKQEARDKTQSKVQRPFFLSSIIQNIGADEIIILALLFLLLEEKIEDEFLLIVLIYLLFAGRE